MCLNRALRGGVRGTLGWRKGGTPQPPLAEAPLKGSQIGIAEDTTILNSQLAIFNSRGGTDPSRGFVRLEWQV